MRVLILENYVTEETNNYISKWIVMENDTEVILPELPRDYEYDLFEDKSSIRYEPLIFRLGIFSRTSLEEMLPYITYDVFSRLSKYAKEYDETWEAFEKWEDECEELGISWELRMKDPVLRAQRDALLEVHQKVEEDFNEEFFSNGKLYLTLGSKLVHCIGIEEFCEMHHIDKVIYL